MVLVAAGAAVDVCTARAQRGRAERQESPALLLRYTAGACAALAGNSGMQERGGLTIPMLDASHKREIGEPWPGKRGKLRSAADL
jgi:hypothetical protein